MKQYKRPPWLIEAIEQAGLPKYLATDAAVAVLDRMRTELMAGRILRFPGVLSVRSRVAGMIYSPSLKVKVPRHRIDCRVDDEIRHAMREHALLGAAPVEREGATDE